MVLMAFIVAMFAALLATIIVLVGAFYPFSVAGRPVGRYEAKMFIGSGIAGTVLLALFCVFITVVWHPTPGFQPHMWGWIVGIGYTVGAFVWVNWFWWDRRTIEVPFVELPREKPTVSKEPAPFEFAAWDDEELR